MIEFPHIAFIYGDQPRLRIHKTAVFSRHKHIVDGQSFFLKRCKRILHEREIDLFHNTFAIQFAVDRSGTAHRRFPDRINIHRVAHNDRVHEIRINRAFIQRKPRTITHNGGADHTCLTLSRQGNCRPRAGRVGKNIVHQMDLRIGSRNLSAGNERVKKPQRRRFFRCAGNRDRTIAFDHDIGDRDFCVPDPEYIAAAGIIDGGHADLIPVFIVDGAVDRDILGQQNRTGKIHIIVFRGKGDDRFAILIAQSLLGIKDRFPQRDLPVNGVHHIRRGRHHQRFFFRRIVFHTFRIQEGQGISTDTHHRFGKDHTGIAQLVGIIQPVGNFQPEGERFAVDLHFLPDFAVIRRIQQSAVADPYQCTADFCRTFFCQSVDPVRFIEAPIGKEYSVCRL